MSESPIFGLIYNGVGGATGVVFVVLAIIGGFIFGAMMYSGETDTQRSVRLEYESRRNDDVVSAIDYNTMAIREQTYLMRK